jgi:hypothetical protein
MARLELLDWQSSTELFEAPKGIDIRNHGLFVDTVNNASKTSQGELEEVLSRFPIAIREKVMRDAKAMASKIGWSGLLPLIGKKKLGEYLGFIKSLELNHENPFGMNLAVIPSTTSATRLFPFKRR